MSNTSPYVTELEVRGIVGTIDDPNIVKLDGFIRSAHLIVTEQLAPKIDPTTGVPMSAARLREIELWLSAHFVKVADMQVKSESAGVSSTYRGNDGSGLEGTTFGQQAITLDTTRTLLAMAKQKPVVSMNVLNSRIPYNW